MTRRRSPLAIAARSQAHDVVFGYAEPLGKIRKNAIVTRCRSNDANLISGQNCAGASLACLILNGAMSDLVRTIFLGRFPGQIGRYVVRAISILVRGFMPIARGRAVERNANQPMDKARDPPVPDLQPHLHVTSATDIRSEDVPRREIMARHCATNPAVAADFIFRRFFYRAPIFLFHDVSNHKKQRPQQQFQRALQAGGF